MRIINFNIQLGGSGERNPIITDYLVNNNFDLIILTEFIKNSSGQEIINELETHGYNTQPSNEEGGFGSLIASKDEFITKNVTDRWAEVYIPGLDLYVLGVYVPDIMGKTKNQFWKRILDYAKNNVNHNVLIAGDFNSCTSDDSDNMSEYNSKDLIKLEELGYTDLWKYSPTDDSDRFTWFYHDGTGFRLDYAFISPHFSSILKEVLAFHDHELRKSKISDHSALIVKLDI